MGYSYDNDACNLYQEVLHFEDLTDKVEDPIIYYDHTRLSYPVCGIFKVFLMCTDTTMTSNILANAVQVSTRSLSFGFRGRN